VSQRIDGIDLTARLSAEESEERIRRASRRLVHLRLLTAGLIDPHQPGPGLIVLFEGFDAAGKGGAIRRLVGGFDPRHVRVVPIGPPSAEELRHHFLWRFSPSLPGRGEMTVYDRSWYGRVLVERVDALATHDEVKRSYGEIVDFEGSLVNDGVTIVKFWMHVSAAEQLRRFESRAADPLKSWKLTPEDWRNREKRDAYLAALSDMVEATDHAHAHWDLISGEDKHFARAAVMETLIARWEHDLVRHGVTLPPSRDADYLQ
jgi:polyphosphate kinase 2 (PPK2 family)